MPYINVDEAYILDNTGLQVDNSVDYANANSNRNLLDNPFFTIRQKSDAATSGSFGANTYVVDRWFTTYYQQASSTWTVTSNGIQLSIGSGGNVVLQQAYNANLPNLNGKTIIISLLLSDGTILAGGAFIRTSGTDQFSTLLTGAFQASIRSDDKFFLQCFAGASGKTIRAIKVETGSYSTLINDTPPDYEKELRHCQFYYRRISNPLGSAIWSLTGGINVLTTAADFALNEPMYANTGSVAFNGTMYVNGNIVTSVNLYSRSNGKFSENTIRFAVASGLTQYGAAAIAMGSGAYVEISHDL